MVWANATSDQTYSFILPSSVAGKQVWIRTKDMDHTVGNVNLDTVFVDQMYVRAATPSGTTGVNLAGPATAINAIDADDQDGDHFADLVVGTAGGKVWKYMGSLGGLTTPAGAYYIAPSAIVGVEFGNISRTQQGPGTVSRVWSTAPRLT